MPVDYALYPPNWKTEIVPEIRARSGGRCEACGVRNHAHGWREDNEARTFHELPEPGTSEFEEANYFLMLEHPDARVIRIVLTVAHKDHDVKNNGEPGNRPNLADWCQLCHNRHDAKMRAGHAQATIARKNGQLSLPQGEEDADQPSRAAGPPA